MLGISFKSIYRNFSYLFIYYNRISKFWNNFAITGNLKDFFSRNAYFWKKNP